MRRVMNLTFGWIVGSFSLLAIAQELETKPIGIRMLNVEVFGKSTNEPVVLLEERKRGHVDPVSVHLDINDDQYLHATVRYPKGTPFEIAYASIGQKYARFEYMKKLDEDVGSIAIWRSVEQRIVIQLTDQKEDGLQLVLITLPDPKSKAEPREKTKPM
jgi:hypothetical protein